VMMRMRSYIMTSGHTELFPPGIGIFQAEFLKLHGDIEVLLLVEQRLQVDRAGGSGAGILWQACLGDKGIICLHR
jgi:hypothetical protein